LFDIIHLKRKYLFEFFFLKNKKTENCCLTSQIENY